MLRKLRFFLCHFGRNGYGIGRNGYGIGRNGYGIGRNGYSVGRNGNHLTNWAETVILPFLPWPKWLAEMVWPK